MCGTRPKGAFRPKSRLDAHVRRNKNEAFTNLGFWGFEISSSGRERQMQWRPDPNMGVASLPAPARRNRSRPCLISQQVTTDKAHGRSERRNFRVFHLVHQRKWSSQTMDVPRIISEFRSKPEVLPKATLSLRLVRAKPLVTAISNSCPFPSERSGRPVPGLQKLRKSVIEIRGSQEPEDDSAA